MSVSSYVSVAILLGFVVSWVPRVAPFILVKYKGLPEIVIRFFEIFARFHFICFDVFKSF